MLKTILFSMINIRQVEESIADRYHEQKMRCPMHLSIGQEAVPATISQFLKKQDFVFSSHRSHAHYISKGGNLKKFIHEFYGLESGCVGGIGGSMHLMDLEAGFGGSTPIVGGIVPIAIGKAWSEKLLNKSSITVIYIGDGCFEEGVIHECMNFAALHSLRVIFVCENNNFSVFTKLNKRQPDRPISNIAKSHGLKTKRYKKYSIKKIMDDFAAIYKDIKKNPSPYFLEYEVYRWREHCGPNFDNELNYRSKKEINNVFKNCPIKNLQNYLLKHELISKDEISSFIENNQKKIDKIFNDINLKNINYKTKLGDLLYD